jgi:hypothetical protein
MKRWRSSLLLAFYRLKSIKRKNKSNVLQAGRAKSMTKNKTEGYGSGEGQKRQGEF